MTSASRSASAGLPTGYQQLPLRLCSTPRCAKRLRPDQYRLGAPIAAVDAAGVTLAGGERIDGAGDRRARAGRFAALDLGWQKFVGREYRLAAPHGLERPIVMDATVDQTDGYRFVYCLPFAEDRMLIEDTYYSTDPGARPRRHRRPDRAPMRVAQGWRIAESRSRGEGRAAGGDGRRLRCLLAGDGEAGADRPSRRLLSSDHRLFAARRGAARLADRAPAAIFSLRRRAARRGGAALAASGVITACSTACCSAPPRPAERYRVLEHFYRLDPATDRALLCRPLDRDGTRSGSSAAGRRCRSAGR